MQTEATIRRSAMPPLNVRIGTRSWPRDGSGTAPYAREGGLRVGFAGYEDNHDALP